MSKIQSAAFEIQSREKGTISLRTIEQIEPVRFEWDNEPITIDLTNVFGSASVSIGGAGPAGSYIAHGGAGSAYNWSNNMNSYSIGSGLSLGPTYNMSNNSITFNNAENKEVLIITKDGDVEWHGKPSEAAEILVKSFQFAVENDMGVTKAARRRYYLTACQNILNKAEKMEHEEFIAFLQKQVYNKEQTVIMDSLRGTE